jgi:Na+-driven multidrug efflux pump
LHDGNNIIRAEGKANLAMVAMIPAFVNIILDIIFIKVMELECLSSFN